jgi:hypothetical protein
MGIFFFEKKSVDNVFFTSHSFSIIFQMQGYFRYSVAIDRQTILTMKKKSPID